MMRMGHKKSDARDPMTACDRELQQRIGHRFQKPALLRRALRHASTGSDNNERLEFLGDRVLALVLAAELYARFPDAPEGALARRFAVLTSRDSCARIAAEWQLEKALERAEGAARRAPSLNMMNDACEAVLGALYLDGGLPAAKACIVRAWTPLLATAADLPQDAKSRLQELALARGPAPPTYRLVTRRGPDHAPHFLVEVELDGVGKAQGRASGLKAAERKAAQNLLQKLDARA